MMTLERTVGKLAEVRFAPPLDMQQLADFMGEIRALVTHAAEPLVFCCDWRGVTGFDDTFADTIVWIMRRDNPLIAANDVLVSSPSLFAQTEQILKDAKNPRWRAFRDVGGARGVDGSASHSRRARASRRVSREWSVIV
ncbi:MAG: hypothetical protein ACREJX_02730, partial [Polyangiaceae bacterium]